MASRRILVVDDDEDIRLVLRGLLERAGYEVADCADGQDAIAVLRRRPVDLVLLDLTMPALDGHATLERLRALSDVPVLLVTARDSGIDKVRGFRAGADDYVVKPFGRQELLARVEAAIRRAPSAQVADRYDDGALVVDFAERSVTAGGRALKLTPLEFRLLTAFVRHPNQVLSPEQLLEQVWGDGDGVSRDQVRLYVSYLRRKLGRAAIENVRGFGYRYVAPL